MARKKIGKEGRTPAPLGYAENHKNEEVEV